MKILTDFKCMIYDHAEQENVYKSCHNNQVLLEKRQIQSLLSQFARVMQLYKYKTHMKKVWVSGGYAKNHT